jgi:hypothetical protein
MIEGRVLTHHVYDGEGKLLTFLSLLHKIIKLFHMEFGFKGCIAQQGTIPRESNMIKLICPKLIRNHRKTKLNLIKINMSHVTFDILIVLTAEYCLLECDAMLPSSG